MSSNFVSPFLEGNAVEKESCQVSDSIPFIAPSMNDSLVDDFLPETNANLSLDDSLCSDDLPQPSPEQATLSHKPVSDYGETVTTDTTGPSSTSLNDSLFDDDETQLQEECVAARVTKQPSLNDSLTMVTQLPEGDVALPEENAHSFTNEQDTSKDPMPENTTACGEKPENVAINSTPVVESAIENPSSAIAAPKDYKTIVPVKQNECKKVRPSFGKKKKSFTPPTSKPVSPNTATSETSVETSPTLSTPTKSKPTLQESTNEINADTVQTEAKTDSIPKKTKAKKKVDFSKQVSSGQDVEESKENTQPEAESKSSTVKSTSTKKSKPAKPKKTAAQEERERKRLERENAKSEKEEAKREKERLKVEKKLEQEKKKAEKGQKKMEKELKKMEKLQTSLAKTKTKLNPPKSSQTDKSEQAPADNCPIDETHDKNDTNAQENLAPMSSTPKEAPPNETGKLDIQELSPIHSTQENSTLMNSTPAEAPFNETSNLDNQKLPTNSIKQSLIHVVCESTIPAKSGSREINKNEIRDNCADAEHNTAKEEHLAKPKKRKQQSDTQVSASKKFKPNFGFSKPVLSQGKQDKPAINLLKKSKPKPSKPSKQAKYSSRSKAVNYSGPVWVQCDSCGKWRTLSSIADPSLVPDHWTCSMNENTEHTTCEAPEEVWSDLGDSQEFVESPFIPGSLVWAKMDGYPWWPAMVEEDPDEETYYEMSRTTDKAAPVRYHVVFLDTPVCRAWVHCQSIRMFTDSEDPNQDCKVKVLKKYHRSLKMSTKQASKALALPFKERLERLSFSQRFRKSGKKRKVASLEEDECLDDKRVKLVIKSGKRKSTHLPVDKVTTPEPLDSLTPVEENTNTSSQSQSSSIATKQGALPKLENKNNDDASLKYMAEE